MLKIFGSRIIAAIMVLSFFVGTASSALAADKSTKWSPILEENVEVQHSEDENSEDENSEDENSEDELSGDENFEDELSGDELPDDAFAGIPDKYRYIEPEARQLPILVNGNDIEATIDYQYLAENLPYAKIMRALGFTVTFNAQLMVVDAMKDNCIIKLFLGSPERAEDKITLAELVENSESLSGESAFCEKYLDHELIEQYDIGAYIQDGVTYLDDEYEFRRLLSFCYVAALENSFVVLDMTPYHQQLSQKISQFLEQIPEIGLGSDQSVGYDVQTLGSFQIDFDNFGIKVKGGISTTEEMTLFGENEYYSKMHLDTSGLANLLKLYVNDAFDFFDDDSEKPIIDLEKGIDLSIYFNQGDIYIKSPQLAMYLLKQSYYYVSDSPELANEIRDMWLLYSKNEFMTPRSSSDETVSMPDFAVLLASEMMGFDPEQYMDTAQKLTDLFSRMMDLPIVITTKDQTTKISLKLEKNFIEEIIRGYAQLPSKTHYWEYDITSFEKTQEKIKQVDKWLKVLSFDLSLEMEIKDGQLVNSDIIFKGGVSDIPNDFNINVGNVVGELEINSKKSQNTNQPEACAPEKILDMKDWLALGDFVNRFKGTENPS